MTTIARQLRAEPRHAVRGWSDIGLLLAGVAVFAACAAVLDRHRVSGAEAAVFRAINNRSLVPQVVVWPIMQLGNFLVIPVVAVTAAVLRRWRLAISLLAAGLSAYLLAAHVVRDTFVRGRPATLLTEVHLRGAPAGGLGFVSGHVAVVTVLAAVAWPYLGHRWRAAVVGLVCLVALARIYVGAHFPLDVLGGAGLGLAVAGAVRLTFGRPRTPSLSPRGPSSPTC